MPEVLYQFEVPVEHMYRFVNDGGLPSSWVEKKMQPCASAQQYSNWCKKVNQEIKELAPDGFFFKIEDITPKDFPGMGYPHFKTCIAKSIEGITYRIKNSMRVQSGIDINLYLGVPIIVTLMKIEDCFKDRNEVRCVIEKHRSHETGKIEWGISAIIQCSILWPPSFGLKFLKRAEKFLIQEVLPHMDRFEIQFPEGVAIDLVDLEVASKKYPLGVRAVEINPLCEELLNPCYAMSWKYVGCRKFVYNRKCNSKPQYRKLHYDKPILIDEGFIPLFERKKRLYKEENRRLLFLPWKRRLIEKEMNEEMSPILFRILLNGVQKLAARQQAKAQSNNNLPPADEAEKFTSAMIEMAKLEQERFSIEYIKNLQDYFNATGRGDMDYPQTPVGLEDAIKIMIAHEAQERQKK